MRAIIMVMVLSVSVWAGPATADQAKFSLQGERLVYDTESGAGGSEIEDADVDVLVDLMRDNPGITTFVLNSGGGSVWAGMEMARIVMDSRSWSPGAVESYYETWREEEGWDTPFEFGSWIYEDTQSEIYDDLRFITSRGVDAEFAIKTKTPRSKTWYPTRAELENAGILTQ